jgi:hypothetical protein
MIDTSIHSLEEIFHLLEIRNFKIDKNNEKNKRKIDKHLQSVESDIENFKKNSYQNSSIFDDNNNYNDKLKFEYEIRLSILEIYNEKIIDLLEGNLNDGKNNHNNNQNDNNSNNDDDGYDDDVYNNDENKKSIKTNETFTELLVRDSIDAKTIILRAASGKTRNSTSKSHFIVIAKVLICVGMFLYI